MENARGHVWIDTVQGVGRVTSICLIYYVYYSKSDKLAAIC